MSGMGGPRHHPSHRCLIVEHPHATGPEGVLMGHVLFFSEQTVFKLQPTFFFCSSSRRGNWRRQSDLLGSKISVPFI